MHNGIARIPPPVNEPVLQYAPGSTERAALKQKLGEMSSETIEIPLVIGGRRIETGRMAEAVCPFDHGHVLARYHQARPEDVEAAIEASQAAWREWSEMAWEDRLAIFLKAADLLAGPWRPVLNAATMLGQAKTAIQAEIDSACELIDFWRFNAHFVEQIYSNQPISPRGFWNRLEFRPLEGFVFAVTPFNFTAIGGNLPTAPAMLGNTVLWKPASTAVLSSYYTLLILEDAGLPPGVLNFLPGRGAEVGDPVLRSPHLAGIHFTGSTNTFNSMWRTIADNVDKYRTYPRIVGETGGKDFVFAHPTANAQAVATALVRGSFEYQGQKCSASSRAYVPRSLWPQISQGLKEGAESLKMGSPLDFRNFMSAVIDDKSFRTLTAAIARAKESLSCEILTGGGSDASKGYFVEPTVIVTTDPRYETMEVELFGPVLTVYVYEDADLEETVKICDSTSPYALTGAIFAQDRQAIVELSKGLRHAAGNFYVNDKPTGAVVGQQPFGGARASGTNDKAGSIFNLLRWTSQRSIKETFVPPTDHRYLHMLEE